MLTIVDVLFTLIFGLQKFTIFLKIAHFRRRLNPSTNKLKVCQIRANTDCFIKLTKYQTAFFSDESSQFNT